jgi:opacity protein-like surface antigen
VIALAVAGSFAPSPAAAERLELSRYGGRLGFSLKPDQFVVGAYADFGELARNLSLRPSVDLGFGSSQFTLIGNGDLQYSFRDASWPVMPYLGAGVALAWSKIQDAPEGADDSDGAVGLNLYAGVERGFGDYNSGHAELRFGIDEIPDFKLVIGYGFY